MATLAIYSKTAEESTGECPADCCDSVCSPDIAMEDLSSFCKRVTQMLCVVPPAGAIPATPPTLFPADNPPSALIYAGEANPAEIDFVRNQLPPESFLLYLYSPCGRDIEDSILAVASGRARTLACSIAPDALSAEKAGAFTALVGGKAVRMIVASGIGARFPTELTAVKKAIRAAVENAGQDATRGLIRLRCSIRNLPGIALSGGLRLEKAVKPVPAVVCGAGPSLSSQFDLLREIAPGVVLIAVGHAVSSLLKAGITPDFIVESDSMSYQNWPADLRCNSVLAAGADVAPSVAARFDKVLWFSGCSNVFNATLDEWGVSLLSIRTGRTVTISAMDLAIRMGCFEIALVGQDLCLARDGLSHVDGKKGELADIVANVPGNDGMPVPVTEDLQGLKQDIEDFIGHVSVMEGVRFVNCTRGGAVIAGTSRVDLAAFAAGRRPLAPDEKPRMERASQNLDLENRIRNLDKALENYSALADRITQACRRLRKDVEDESIGSDRIRADQARVNDLMAREGRERPGSGIAAVWLNTFLKYADDLAIASPEEAGGNPDPIAPLRLLERRFRLVRDLCGDVRSDMRFARAGFHGRDCETGTDSLAPYVFESFRKDAIIRIRAGNPEFAAFLEKKPVLKDDCFKTMWMNQLVPYVEVLTANGRQAVSGFISMFKEAETEIAEFAATERFDPATRGAVIICPGNWVDVFAFCRRFPDAGLITVDPWPELFSEMIARGCFLNVLPENALVVAASDQVGDWRGTVAAELRKWRARGLEPAFWVPPRCRALPGIAELEHITRGL